MENGFSSPRTDTFPAGLRVLVVDDDPTWLKILEKMLKKCSYEVTTCCLAREALKVLRERKDGFDIVISDVNMPDMDGFKLLEHVGLEMDLPVIMMSVDGETSRVMKGVQHGACDYLLKPVRMKELKNIWQHVFRKKIHEVKDVESYEVSGDSQMMRTGSGIFEDGSFLSGGDFSSVRKRKDRENKDLDDQDFNDPAAAKRARVVWSVDLHQKFVNAVDQIGLDKVGPKKILDLMNVPWLTRENVASHLQKYRLYLSRLQNQNEPRTSFGGIKQQDITPKDPLASFVLQSSIKVHQENTTNCNFGYSTNKILVQGVNPNFDEGDLKSIVSFSQRTEPRKALTSDLPQKKSSGSQLGVGHSFGSLEMVVDYPSFEPSLSQQRSWNKEASVMQFLQPPKQEHKPSGYTHVPHSSPKLHIQANSVGLAPSIHHGNSLTERAKANPPETKILSTAYRNNHARNTSPTGLIIGSFSSHAETESFNLHGFGPNTTITESSSAIHQSFDQKSASNWDSNLLNLSPQSGSTLQSPLEVLQLYSLQDYDSIGHIGLTNLEYLDCHDVELFSAVPGQPYDRVRLHRDYLCDSMEYPCVDQGLFIA